MSVRPIPYTAITAGSPEAVDQPSGKMFTNQTTPRTLTVVPRYPMNVPARRSGKRITAPSMMNGGASAASAYAIRERSSPTR